MTALRDPSALGVGRPRLPRAATAAALAVVLAGVIANLVRPLAPEVPGSVELARWFDPAFLARVRAYKDPLYAALAVATVLRLAVLGVAVWTPRGRRAVARLVALAGPRRPALGAGLTALVLVVVADLVVLPLSFWIGFVREGAFGFRTQGLGGWAYDALVAAVPAWLAVLALVTGGYALARRLPTTWPVVAGLVAAALSGLVVLAAPLVLEPLSFRLSPLPAGPVRDEVEVVLARAGVDVDALLVADASRRTTKENAYVSGLGPTRRVVLYDTILDRPPAEVGAVLAHELGHRLHRDLLRRALLGAAGSVISALVLAALVRRRTAAGRQDHDADPRAIAVVLLAASLLLLAGAPVANLASRRAEAAADAAALVLARPEAVTDLLLGLAESNLSDPRPPTWAYALWFTHPTIASRLHRAAHAAP